MPAGCRDWVWLSKLVRELPIVNSFPWGTERPGSDPSAFSIFPTKHVFLPQSIYMYDTYQQVHLGVTGTSKVGSNWWHLSPTMSDVKFMAIHSFVELLSGLDHRLETTPSVGHSEADLSICVIDRLWKEDVIHRKNRERRWIRTLGTLWPRRMNLQSDPLWPSC